MSDTVYRELTDGELILKGDEYLGISDGIWKISKLFNENQRVSCNKFCYCRPIREMIILENGEIQ